MLARRIIPCLDVKAGRVVKGVQFVGLRDAGDPVECATRYDAEGADEITFLDITASSDERRILLDVVERTAAAIAVPLTVGGGVRVRDDVRDLLAAGADQGSLNTAAVRGPALVGAVAAPLRGPPTAARRSSSRSTRSAAATAGPCTRTAAARTRASTPSTGPSGSRRSARERSS